MDPRETAIARLDDLLRVFKTAPNHGALSFFIEQTEHLQRAIAAFHREGIRFCAFTLERRLAATPEVPPEARPLFAEVKQALEAAGFQIKSH